ncbi:MAG: Ppx/GppA family phosphatase [Peptococcaceae bacterium]|nr:Ppx/GppA family phosphatase [Peptococcaceae bacterium]
MKRVAVIDIGTNSTRLLVADVDGAGRVEPLHADLKTTRLGQGIEGRFLLPEAVSRTVEAISDMQRQARERSASRLVAAATSAVRDADNRDRFLDLVFRKTGIRVRVLEGVEEARLSYLGVAAGFGGDMDGAVIVDIGGGSTEFTWNRRGRVTCRSVNAGAVRMTEGGHDDRAIGEILREITREIRRERPRELIGVGGTVTTLAAMEMKMEVYDRNRVHGCTLEEASVRRLLEELVRAGPEGRKRMPGLQPARADIIVAGVRILLEVMKGLEFGRIRVSEADLMYGLALEEARLSK